MIAYSQLIKMENISTLSPDTTKIRREHVESLNFCSRIRTGLSNDVEPNRIRQYTDWFKENHLEPHFQLEEKLIFPVLGQNARVKRALANHRRINRLLNCGCENEKVLNLLEEELESYIRFEEKTLYREIDKIAHAKEIEEFEKHHEYLHSLNEEWKDKFWLD